jgi:hypothetical protein
VQPPVPSASLVGVCGLGVLVFLVAAALILLQKGSRRAALVAPLAPLMALPTLLAVALGSWKILDAIASMAMAGSEGGAAFVVAGHEIWLLTRSGGATVAVLGMTGLIGGLIRTGADDPAPECSPLRAVMLLLLPAAALLLLAGVVREERTALHVVRIVAEDRSPTNEAALAAYGFGEGSGSLAAISRRVARATTLGSIGSILAAVILLGLAVTGGLLAWPVRVGLSFTAASALIWVAVVATGAAVAAGVYSPF